MIRLIPYSSKASQLIRHSSSSLDGKTVEAVSSILEDVKRNGDRALVKYSRRFDCFSLKPSQMRIKPARIKKAHGNVDRAVLMSLKAAHRNILKFHREQHRSVKKTLTVRVSDGIAVGERVTPIDSVGCYVPGGSASYPSSVLMTCIPASVAGVRRIVVVSPPPVSDEVLVAADLCGVKEVYNIGGAQAIAALAYGTRTVKPVSKIVGPGNKYVTAAKKLVYGTVDVDMPAGPSEVLIIADNTAKPGIIASDILAQAEHDVNSISVLVTSSRKLAQETKKAVDELVSSEARQTILAGSLKNSAIVVANTLGECIDFANEFAPEHLEILTRNPEQVAGKIDNAGAVFLGPYSPVAAGDYASGGNHVLPTGGSARFASPLSVRDFLKYTSVQKLTERGLRSISKTVGTLAEAERLPAHKRSVDSRLEQK
ncbi:MAG: histidinol dehydrogenase [Candidatus Altiarchaeota archaeon]